MTSTRRDLLICIGLALLTVACYWPVLGHEFINYDDDHFVTDNAMVQRGVTIAGLKWTVSAVVVSNWHPVTLFSHMLDVQIYGKWAGGHHLTSLVLHIANALLLYGVLRHMTSQHGASTWRSALVAALFAVHPLHVESVAWVAERKDVLCTVFGLLALWWYVRYAERTFPGAATKRRGLDFFSTPYLLTTLFFALGLLSKPMLVTLPCVMLLLDYWPLRRMRATGSERGGGLSFARLFAEKLPFFAMSAAISFATLWAQRSGGAVVSLERIPPAARVSNAIVSYAHYLWLTIWPADLAVLYPHPGSHAPAAVAGAAGLLFAISALTIFLRKRHPHLLIGWLWFLGTLVPVIGLVQVGAQSMADRYTYVPHIGVFIMLAWSLPGKAREAATWTVSGLAAAVLAILSYLTFAQVQHWRDSVRLFEHALAVTSDNYIVHNNLGEALLLGQGRLDDAIGHFREAVRIMPRYAHARSNLAAALLMKHSTEPVRTDLLREVIIHAEEAIRLDDSLAEAHDILGVALGRDRRPQEAELHHTHALRLRPDVPAFHAHMGLVLAQQNRIDEAITYFEEALRLEPDNPQYRQFLDTARLQRAAQSAP